jgi:hypothetical protein
MRGYAYPVKDIALSNWDWLRSEMAVSMGMRAVRAKWWFAR